MGKLNVKEYIICTTMNSLPFFNPKLNQGLNENVNIKSNVFGG